MNRKLIGFVALASVFAGAAHALTITIDGSTVPILTGSGTPSIPGAAPLLYGGSKSADVVSEVGDISFIGSYTSAWTTSDKVVTTTNTSAATINADPIYVAVWNTAGYTGDFEVFIVANWDGSALRLDRTLGASVDIPSYKIFGNQVPEVPDGGSTLALFGFAVVGLGFIYRWRVK